MRAILVMLLFTFASFLTPEARAEQLHLLGEWQQIESNAGKCDDCRITIRRTGTHLTITGSNGWSAVVKARPGTNGAIGWGKWEAKSGGSYGGHEFTLHIGTVHDKLLMVMSVPKPGNKISKIKAAFEKIPWANKV
jgi:hypothetical protein